MDKKTRNGEGTCLQCGKPFYGRKDKQFCSISCKNRWHNQILQRQRQFRADTIAAITRNYEILEELLKDERTSASLTELEKAGFDPAFVTGYRKGSCRHDDFACFDISFYRSNTKIFNIRRKRLNGS